MIISPLAILKSVSKISVNPRSILLYSENIMRYYLSITFSTKDQKGLHNPDSYRDTQKNKKKYNFQSFQNSQLKNLLYEKLQRIDYSDS